MNYIRKITNSDIFNNIIELPANLKHKQVEIIILPYEENKNEEGLNKNSARGILSKYKNPLLIMEEEEAWSKAMVEKYEDR